LTTLGLVLRLPTYVAREADQFFQRKNTEIFISIISLKESERLERINRAIRRFAQALTRRFNERVGSPDILGFLLSKMSPRCFLISESIDGSKLRVQVIIAALGIGQN